MISREELLTQLQAMPSSLNDAMRTMELAADFIGGGAQRAPDTVIEEFAKIAEAATVSMDVDGEQWTFNHGVNSAAAEIAAAIRRTALSSTDGGGK